MASLPDGYISVVDADVINTSTAWNDSSTEEKETALSWGRIYIDSSYSCTIDEAEPSDNIQYANALFGDLYVGGELYPSAGSRSSDKVTTEEKTKAGSVEISEKFAVSSSGNAVQVDPFANISALLSIDGCSYTVGSTPGVISMVRAQ